jgi:hypothetical protein
MKRINPAIIGFTALITLFTGAIGACTLLGKVALMLGVEAVLTNGPDPDVSTGYLYYGVLTALILFITVIASFFVFAVSKGLGAYIVRKVTA